MTNIPAPTNLKCEYSVNPIGIDVLRPRLFWQLSDTRRGARQTAYQIIAGTRPGEADLWDTGKVVSDATTHVEYGGAPLGSGQRVYWRVRAWDAQDQPTSFSSVSFFEMGLLSPSDWAGQWLTHPGKTHDIPGPAVYLRKSFVLPAGIASARLYITARGVYIPMLNGQPAGKDRLTPGWTDYNIRIRYQTYDVTEQLRKGDNALGIILGDGWYAGHMIGKGRLRFYGDRPWLLGQLHVTFQDGRQMVIPTDASWLASKDGPIVQQSFLHGDTIDARKAWNFSAPQFAVKGWRKAQTQARDGVALLAQAGPTVQKIDELPTAAYWKLPGGDWVFDLGQNMVGVVRLKTRGKRGQALTVRHGEALNSKDDRSVYLANLRGAKATDQFILAGNASETFEPPFTLHGFRYVQVSGLTARPNKSTVTGLAYHSAAAPAGQFSCSHPKLNQLQRNILWGQKGNFVEVPTDCPQRDERLGWMGDAQVFIRTACFNMEVAGFFGRWLLDVADAQHADGAYPDVVPDLFAQLRRNRAEAPAWGTAGAPGWGDAGVICPWTIYQCYGDRRILENQYDSMCRYIDYLVRRCPAGLHPDFGYGDWLAIGSQTSKELIGVAYSAYSISLMGKIAKLLGKAEDERRFAALFEYFKTAFNREFVTPAGRLVSPSQTAAIMALRFALVDEPVYSRLAKWLGDDVAAKGVLTTGFLGCNLILPTLSQIGRDDLAWQLLSSEKFPSWLFSVNQGATTIWERWDGWTPEKGFQKVGMNSFNHYAYGSCGQWMYARIGAIDTAENYPGFKQLLIEPLLAPGLTSGQATLQTLHGEARTQWKRKGEEYSLQVVIPPNTSALIYLPGEYTQGDADKSQIVQIAKGRTVLKLPAGRYRLRSILRA